MSEFGIWGQFLKLDMTPKMSSKTRSRPEIAIQGAVLYRLPDMLAEDVLGAGEVGDRAGDF